MYTRTPVTQDQIITMDMTVSPTQVAQKYLNIRPTANYTRGIVHVQNTNKKRMTLPNTRVVRKETDVKGRPYFSVKTEAI